MEGSLHIVDLGCKPKVYIPGRDIPPRRLQNVDMSKRTAPPNNLRAWRVKRGLTQEQLAEMVGTTKAAIGHLETGERGLSDKWLRKLAPALGTTAGFLLDHDPNDIADFVDAWNEVPEDQKKTALRMLRALKTGTDDA